MWRQVRIIDYPGRTCGAVLSLFRIGTATQLRGYSAALRHSLGESQTNCKGGKSGLWQSRKLALVRFRPAPEIQPVEHALTINIKEEAL
jgi:hypothetical protein